MTNHGDQWWEQQGQIKDKLCERVSALLREFGQQELLPRDGDYDIIDDFLGHPELVVYVMNLTILRPNIVANLQQIIRDYPGWQIVMAVAMRGHERDWPDMGLYIRPYEIVDALQRQYFPEEFQGLEYGGARRGTAHD
jgi:hypothetical protein